MTYGQKFVERILNLHVIHKFTFTHISIMMHISRKTIYNWRKNKNIQIKTKKYKKNKYTPELEQYIVKYVTAKGKFKIRNLQSTVNKKFNIMLKRNTVYYILRKHNITYKKARKFVIINKREHNKKVKELKKEINKLGSEKIISIDEAHFELNMKPNMGWNYKGQQVKINKCSGVRKSISLLCAISNNKICEYELINGPVDAKIFKNFIEKINNKHKHKYMLMDNCRIHHAKIIKEYMDTTENEIIFNVPYNPETNPIEQLFSVIKQKINLENTSTPKKLKYQIERLLHKIPAEHLNNFFNHSFA